MGISETWIKSRTEGIQSLGMPTGRQRLVDFIGRHAQLGVKHAEPLAMLGVGYGGDGHMMLVDLRDLHDRRLDAHVRNHLAGDLGKPAEPIGDLEKAVRVDVSQVARQVPAVLDHPGRRLGLVEIADHHLGPFHRDDPLGPERKILSGVGIDGLEHGSGNGKPHGPRPVAVHLASIRQCHLRGTLTATTGESSVVP